jgi:hypothetical protein
LGSHLGGTVVFAYRALTFYGDCFRKSSTNAVLCHSLTDRQIRPSGPTTPVAQRLPAITRDWFGLFRFRSPLLTESHSLSLPAGNEMFHFPAFPPLVLCVQTRVTGFRVLPGFPIRKSSDRSSVDSSPRLIAASYVLHRLLVPRHPPCALNNLTTKMLASTVQFSRYGRSRSCRRGVRTARLCVVPRSHRSVPRTQPPARLRTRGCVVALRRTRSLRTQQRAWAGWPPRSRFRTP